MSPCRTSLPLRGRCLTLGRPTCGRYPYRRTVVAKALQPIQRSSESRVENLIDDLERSFTDEAALDDQIELCTTRVAALGTKIDAEYKAMLDNRTVTINGESHTVSIASDGDMQRLGKEEPEVAKALLSTVLEEDSTAWSAFQSRVTKLKLQRSEAQQTLSTLRVTGADARSAAAAPAEEEEEEEQETEAAAAARAALLRRGREGTVRVVLVTGFESFNQSLYRASAKEVQRTFPSMRLSVFSDRDIQNPSRRADLERALATADVFFGSLLFDFDDVEWLRARVAEVPLRFVFESALELMGETRVGGSR